MSLRFSLCGVHFPIPRLDGVIAADAYHQRWPSWTGKWSGGCLSFQPGNLTVSLTTWGMPVAICYRVIPSSGDHSPAGSASVPILDV